MVGRNGIVPAPVGVEIEVPLCSTGTKPWVEKGLEQWIVLWMGKDLSTMLLLSSAEGMLAERLESRLEIF